MLFLYGSKILQSTEHSLPQKFFIHIFLQYLNNPFNSQTNLRNMFTTQTYDFNSRIKSWPQLI